MLEATPTKSDRCRAASIGAGSPAIATSDCSGRLGPAPTRTGSNRSALRLPPGYMRKFGSSDRSPACASAWSTAATTPAAAMSADSVRYVPEIGANAANSCAWTESACEAGSAAASATTAACNTFKRASVVVEVFMLHIIGRQHRPRIALEGHSGGGICTVSLS